jgi:hypothetical protein
MSTQGHLQLGRNSFFCRCIPDKTHLKVSNALVAGNQRKGLYSLVTVGCNAENFPLFVMGKLLNPRCFKNV